MALSALVSLAVLVDVGLIAVDLDTVLGVLAVVAVTVGADKRLVAVAGSLPLVKTLGAPVSVGVAGAILIVPITSSRVVSKGRGIARLSLPLVGATVPPASNETSLASKTKTKSLESKKGEGRGGQQLGRPLVDTKTLGAPVSVRVAGTVLVVAISASRVVGKGRGIARLSLPLVDALGRPVSVRVAGTVLVVSIATSRVVGKGRGIAGLSLPLVGATVPPASNETSLASKTPTKSLKSKKGEGRGGQQLGRPLVDTMDTLGAPVSVRVTRTVLVVAISASRMVSKGRGIAGLSLPLVGTTPPSVQETSLASKSSNQKLSSEKGEGRGGQQLGRPLVDTMKTLGAPPC